MMIFSLLLVLSVFISFSSGVKECFQFQACKDENVAQDIDCRGYQSCQGVTGGSMDATCNGFQSCMGTNLKLQGEVYAGGCEAMKDSRIFARRVHCTGQRACDSATIYPTQEILDVDCEGEHSCLNTKVKCADGQICTVSCLGSGCEALEGYDPTYFDCTRNAQCTFECLEQYCPNRRNSEFALNKANAKQFVVFGKEKDSKILNNNNAIKTLKNTNHSSNTLYILGLIFIAVIAMYYAVRKYTNAKDVSYETQYQPLVNA